MPNFMCINANVVNDVDLTYWIAEGITVFLNFDSLVAASNSKYRWLPSKLALIIRNGELSIVDLDKSTFDVQSYGPDAEVAIFDLRSTIAEVKIGKGLSHLVSHINVSESNQPEWYFFNDFSVLPLENEERVFQKWKVSTCHF